MATLASYWFETAGSAALLLAEPGFRCLASVTVCVLVYINVAVGDIAECAFKCLYCKLR